MYYEALDVSINLASRILASKLIKPNKIRSTALQEHHDIQPIDPRH